MRRIRDAPRPPGSQPQPAQGVASHYEGQAAEAASRVAQHAVPSADGESGAQALADYRSANAKNDTAEAVGNAVPVAGGLVRRGMQRRDNRALMRTDREIALSNLGDAADDDGLRAGLAEQAEADRAREERQKKGQSGELSGL